ncbi:MAG: hypothetical protein LBS67_03530 [Clostridiales Family XIII bacterium]|nr:hypothetical protein [Clostridiales Family XIII bacterium]
MRIEIPTNEEMRIEMPTNEEMRIAAGRILAATSDVGGGAFRHFRGACRALGVRTVFAGVADCLVLAAAVSVCFYGLWLVVVINNPEISLATIFVIAPVFFMMLHLFTLWKERLCGTLDLLLSCKYTPVWLTALRMLRSGFATIAVNAALALAASVHPGISAIAPLDVLRVIAYSSLSVCVYAALLLAVLIHAKGTRGYTLLPVLWLGALPVLILRRGAEIDDLMRESPAGVAPLITVCIGIVILLETNNLLRSGRACRNGKELIC